MFSFLQYGHCGRVHSVDEAARRFSTCHRDISRWTSKTLQQAGVLDAVVPQLSPHVIRDRSLLAEAVGAHENMNDAALPTGLQLPWRIKPKAREAPVERGAERRAQEHRTSSHGSQLDPTPR
jgi:hypothetical protein